MEGMIRGRKKNPSSIGDMYNFERERELGSGILGASRKTAGNKPMSKGCPQYAVDLSAYFDGELEGEALQRVESHVKTCGACRASLEKFGKIRLAMNQLVHHPVGRASILEAVKARLEEESDPKTPKPLVS